MTVQESKRGTSSKRRQPVGLGSGLEKWLSAYAAASIAAGVSMLAMTKSAEAKIVYTPADTNIPVNNRESFLLDLNHDGIADFAFWNLSFRSDLGFRLSIGCAPIPFHSTGNCRYQENEIWGKGVASGRFASALRAGFTVGANKSYFQQGRNWRGAPQAQHGRLLGEHLQGQRDIWPMDVYQTALSRVAVRDRRASPLWLGPRCCDSAAGIQRNQGHADWLRLRNHSKPTDRDRKNERAGRYHAGTG